MGAYTYIKRSNGPANPGRHTGISSGRGALLWTGDRPGIFHPRQRNKGWSPRARLHRAGGRFESPRLALESRYPGMHSRCGVTQLHLHANYKGEQARIEEEADLIARWEPVCNTQATKREAPDGFSKTRPMITEDSGQPSPRSLYQRLRAREKIAGRRTVKLEASQRFLQKPYSRAELLGAVRN
jgi:hypothetical protein